MHGLCPAANYLHDIDSESKLLSSNEKESQLHSPVGKGLLYSQVKPDLLTAVVYNMMGPLSYYTSDAVRGAISYSPGGRYRGAWSVFRRILLSFRDKNLISGSISLIRLFVSEQIDLYYCLFKAIVTISEE